ncbi:flavohemoglobin expression-modulating QEGLA motif protein [Sorangium sp. So ce429]
MSIDSAVLEQLERVGGRLAEGKAIKLLDDIAWPREVEERFFASGEDRLPEVEYRVDRDGLGRRIAELRELLRSIDGDAPALGWLRDNVRAQIQAAALLDAAGTREFSARSRELYGGARTRFFGGALRNIDLAEHLTERLQVHGWDEASDPEEEPLDAAALRDQLAARVAARRPPLDIEIALDPRITAKVVAGMSRIRIRPEATFASWEAEGLWHHEVETHALTAHNGAAQPRFSFLRSGGPRTTRTQEGLAIFAELYSRSLSIGRLTRLAERVRLVDMAEQGASFLDLYRHLRERGAERRDAYFDAQRVCRGGLCEGGAPFTKDACYLAGLLEVYAFLAAVLRGGLRDEVELLVCGRIALDDIAVLAELRAAGALERPRYLPGWLRAWQTLLPYFAFTSFMDGIDLGPVERHFQELLRVAADARPAEEGRRRRGRPPAPHSGPA